MKLKIIYLSLFAGLAVIFALCQPKKDKIDTSENVTPVVKKSITIYGSENCDHCLEFRHKADSLKIKYQFKDAEASEANYNELVLKIQQAGIPGYISFPVIEIDDELYIRPKFENFLRVLER